MKTTDQVDVIMSMIPEDWRYRWCGGENGPCACMGCVYTGSKQVVANKITKTPYRGDPEYINESELSKNHPDIYENYMLTREEWSAWVTRHEKTKIQTY